MKEGYSDGAWRLGDSDCGHLFRSATSHTKRTESLGHVSTHIAKHHWSFKHVMQIHTIDLYNACDRTIL